MNADKQSPKAKSPEIVKEEKEIVQSPKKQEEAKVEDLKLEKPTISVVEDKTEADKATASPKKEKPAEVEPKDSPKKK